MATDPDAPAFYPRASRYFARIEPDRPLFQGDIFRGAFGAFWRHPAAVRASLAGMSQPEDPAYPGLDRLKRHALVQGQGYGMLLPQPCEFSEFEKGATHPFRLVAPLFPLNARAGVDHALVPGMQVSAEIRLGSRTVLEYLLSPVQKAALEAGRER